MSMWILPWAGVAIWFFTTGIVAHCSGSPAAWRFFLFIFALAMIGFNTQF